jgi:hypothetical protein
VLLRVPHGHVHHHLLLLHAVVVKVRCLLLVLVFLLRALGVLLPARPTSRLRRLIVIRCSRCIAGIRRL